MMSEEIKLGKREGDWQDMFYMLVGAKRVKSIAEQELLFLL